jgi:hypothetical protein
MSFTNEPKSSAPVYTNEAKASSTFKTILRHGKAASFDQWGDRVLDEPNFIRDETLEETTFDQVADQEWTNQPKS